jgi:type I restriction enzyme S subunit
MKGVVFPDTMIAARVSHSRILPSFLSAIWKSSRIRRQIDAGARTTNGTFKINQGVVEAISILVPPLEKQQAFAEVETRVSRNAADQRSALGASDALANSLVARALSGSMAPW